MSHAHPEAGWQLAAARAPPDTPAEGFWSPERLDQKLPVRERIAALPASKFCRPLLTQYNTIAVNRDNLGAQIIVQCVPAHVSVTFDAYDPSLVEHDSSVPPD